MLSNNNLLIYCGFQYFHNKFSDCSSSFVRTCNLRSNKRFAEVEMQNKRDFGSFHSSNVQDLLSISNDKYVPPVLPLELHTFCQENDVGFGKETKKKHFYLEEHCTFLNHGAFGAVLKPALEDAQKWQIYIERQPLRFFDRELLPLLSYVTRQLADFVNCDAADLVLVPNVTTAMNCVLRSQKFVQGDKIFCLSTTYGAVKKILKQVCHDTGAILHEQPLQFPIDNPDQICDIISKNLKDGTKFAVLDHIPSNTPFILPVTKVVEICHARGVKVLIDGAHALGQLDLDISAFGGVDYYTSNAHKWFCCPKGAAFLYVDKKHQSSTRPLIISHGHESGFNSEFIWSGLRDYSPFLSLLTVLSFWRMHGAAHIRAYINQLSRDAAQLLTEKWETSSLVPVEMTGSMLCVEVPEKLFKTVEQITYSSAEDLQNKLYHRYNIEVPVKAVQGKLYVRISCHIHNCIEDYQRLAEAVLELKETS